MIIRTGDKEKDRILGLMADMKYKELKMNCLERGLAFELAVTWDAPKLSGWLLKHWDNERILERLKVFDTWVDGQLSNKYDANHPLRKFKEYSMPLEEEAETPKPKPEKKVTTPKPKKEKDKTFNIYKGTKKELVYSLSAKLKKDFGEKYPDNKVIVKKFFAQMVEKVKKKFPDDEVNEKSVRIWMKRCLDNEK